MRFRFTLITTALSVVSLLFPGLAHLKGNNATQDKGGPPAAGVFRVVLNGFKVNHESDDDILEGDGKRDEVYLRADVWVLNRDGSVPYRHSPRSVLMGDINNQSDPRRIAAGTASDDGGLRTNDKWPINEPWRRVRSPLADRTPMLLWEGQLSRGENMAVIIPTVWEWDSRDPSTSEISWDGSDVNWPTSVQPSSVAGFFADSKADFLNRLAANSSVGYPTPRPHSGVWFVDRDGYELPRAGAGTRPIGGFTYGLTPR